MSNAQRRGRLTKPRVRLAETPDLLLRAGLEVLAEKGSQLQG